jgi:two-component system sensor histidine kinase PilS (NtrC family)
MAAISEYIAHSGSLGIVTIIPLLVARSLLFLATDNLPNTRQQGSFSSEPDLNRRILTLVASFRLLLTAGLVLVAVLQSTPMYLGERFPPLFIGLTCIYSISAVIIALAIRGDNWRTIPMAWVQLCVDISCVVLIVHTSGGTDSGIEGLLVVFVVAIGMTLPVLAGFLAAALASLAVLLEQSLSFLQGVSTATEFIPAGVVGAIMLAITAAVQPLVRRVRETEELALQRGIDLENLAQLNDYIIQNLRESIIVIDENEYIRLINQTAAEQLGAPELRAGNHLGYALPQLLTLLKEWRLGKLDLSRDIPSFLSADGSTVISAHFAPLSDDNEAGPVLVFLEDASLLGEKVQQSKLAALGRFSASIAHEIRNPVGALSHAAQLLRESADIGEQDKRFIDIIQTNSRRVSEIIDNILQLSRKDTVKPQRLQLEDWCSNFVDEFVSTLELYEGQVSIQESQDAEVRMDPSHLHQIAWNLCENSVKYASETAGAIAVEIRFGRLPNGGRPFLEIRDHGPGIPAELEESVFEPFATGRAGGTGLGLYICRELCERSRATLRYRQRDGGGSIFQIVFADPGRWDTQESTS